MPSLVSMFGRQVVPVDRKTARGLHDEARAMSPLYRVSAWADSRSTGITAIPELLETLALDVGIVTIDRIPSGWGCQKRIVQTIRDREVDYVPALRRRTGRGF